MTDLINNITGFGCYVILLFFIYIAVVVLRNRDLETTTIHVTNAAQIEPGDDIQVLGDHFEVLGVDVTRGVLTVRKAK
jgi:hypothetical protein